MAYYIYDGSGNRTVEAKTDIEDLITNLDPDNTPLLSSFRRRKVQDSNPKTLSDSLSAIDTSNAHAEDAAAPAASDTARAIIQNWCQILQKTAEVSDVQNATAQYGMGKELQYQEMKKTIEIKLDIEAFLLSDQVRQAPTSANSRIAKMDGASTIVSTHTNATFSQANFDTLSAACAADGGRPTIAYMDSTRKIAVGAWTSTPTRFTTNIKKVESEVLVYHSDIGEDVKMLWHHLMAQDIDGTDGATFLAIQPNLWQICELISLMRKSLPDTGAGPSTLIKWVGSPLCRAEEGNIRFY